MCKCKLIIYILVISVLLTLIPYKNLFALETEIPGGIAEAVVNYYDNSDVALTSYAQPSIGGCGAAMIGPNILITAAHCGADDTRNVKFRTYQNGDLYTSQTETFTCHYLLQTGSDMDLVIYYCEPNEDGENPGDKYGYLDYDVEDPTKGFDINSPSIGDEVYSIWPNTISNPLTVYDARIYSKGEVVSTTTSGWYTPENVPNIGITTNTWTCPGASGSVQLNPLTHRILIGPTSTGSNCGASRNALSIFDHLVYGWVANTNPNGWAPPRNIIRINELGLYPTNYLGPVDFNNNFIFDIQEDLEHLRGESSRDYYYFNFESNRQNVLWTTSPYGSLQGFGKARIYRSDAGSNLNLALSHPKLNLKGNQRYQVSMNILTKKASYDYPLYLGLYDPDINRLLIVYPLALKPNSTYKRHTLPIWVPDEGLEFRIYTRGGTYIYFEDIAFIGENAIMNFDSHDQRKHWRDPSRSTHALILPDGINSPAETDWAGVVRSSGKSAYRYSYSLASEHLGLDAGKTYQIRFKVKNNQADPLWAGKGRLLVYSPGAVLRCIEFDVTNTWTERSTGSFTVSSDDAKVLFGIKSHMYISGSYIFHGSYLVDDIEIIQRQQ